MAAAATIGSLISCGPAGPPHAPSPCAIASPAAASSLTTTAAASSLTTTTAVASSLTTTTAAASSLTTTTAAASSLTTTTAVASSLTTTAAASSLTTTTAAASSLTTARLAPGAPAWDVGSALLGLLLGALLGTAASWSLSRGAASVQTAEMGSLAHCPAVSCSADEVGGTASPSAVEQDGIRGCAACIIQCHLGRQTWGWGWRPWRRWPWRWWK